MRPPSVSALRETISIITVTAPFTVNRVGTLVSTIATVRAAIEPLGGDVMETTQQHQAYTQGYRIWIRYRSDVTPFQQITWGTKRLYQTAPPEEISGGAGWLLIHAEEQIDQSI